MIIFEASEKAYQQANSQAQASKTDSHHNHPDSPLLNDPDANDDQVEHLPPTPKKV